MNRVVWSLCIVGLLILSSCGETQPPPNITITGTLSANILPATTGGPLTTGPVAGTIYCNNHINPTDAAGAFTLSLPRVAHYHCVLTAPQWYVAETLDFDQARLQGNDVALRFASSDKPCYLDVSTMWCPPLQLQPGTIQGSITSKSGSAANQVMVGCDNRLNVTTSLPKHAEISTTTTPIGAFQLNQVPVGTYLCFLQIANVSFSEPKTVVVTPFVIAKIDFTLCDSCNLSYHAGPIIHTLTAYLIYWNPANTTFDPTHDNALYESKMTQFFHDIGGSDYYNLLTQYSDGQGHVQNTVTLGGSFIDQQQLPAPGTTAHPLYGQDIENEITQDIGQAHWSVTNEHVFFIFTPSDVQICDTPTGNPTCTFGQQAFCGYHTSTSSDTQPTLYAVIPANSACSFKGQTPNGDGIIDASINVVAHEMFETVSDPLVDASGNPNGWFRGAAWDPQNESEIGDVCESEPLPSLFADGGDVTLNQHDYLIQPMWSNLADMCVWQ